MLYEQWQELGCVRTSGLGFLWVLAVKVLGDLREKPEVENSLIDSLE